MRIITTTTQLLLTLLALAVFAWAGWQGYLLLTGEQKTLEPSMQSLLVIGAVVALTCAYMLATAIRKGATTVATGKRKAELYEQFIFTWRDLNGANEVIKGKVEKEIDDLKAGIGLLSSRQVVRKMNQLLFAEKETGPISSKTKAAFEDLLAAMRSDLGLYGPSPFDGELQKLFSASIKEDKKTIVK